MRSAARLCVPSSARALSTGSARPAVSAARSRITESAWTAIRYPQAVWDDEQRWISDAEVAEVPFTAFTGRRKAEHVTGRLGCTSTTITATTQRSARSRPSAG